MTEKMLVRRFRVTMLTPAFLGDANQNGCWRTPAFKAQLRQFWRMAYAAAHGFQFPISRMRAVEGELFGNAWLEDSFRKSKVRLRLKNWEEGTLKEWTSDFSIKHENVQVPVGAHLYLGFGPLVPAAKTRLKKNAAIQAQPDGKQELLLAFPESARALIEAALTLMQHYGTVGGRSRNGWGSYSLEGQDDASKRALQLPLPPLQPLRNALEMDWPHAIGADGNGVALVWKTKPHAEWESLMKTLAQLKIALRTQFKMTTGQDAPRVEDRHWLSYPITNHLVKAWGNNARLPNTLRFKIRQAPDGKLVGVVFHVPHLPPCAFNPAGAEIHRVWKQVHRFLDEQGNSEFNLTRSEG